MAKVKPYFEHHGITLYHGDAIEIMRSMIGPFDLLLTDPPYGMNWQSTSRQRAFDRIAGDESTDLGELGLALAMGLLRPHRHFYAFGRWTLEGLPVGGSCELIWDKGMGGLGDTASGHPWAPAHEPITFGVYVPSKVGREAGDGGAVARLRRGSVLHYPRLNSGAIKRHPTEKPVDLLRELIESSSRMGEIVLDPFAGSGSTLEACLREGRRAVGIEIEERYCAAAAERLRQANLL